MHEGKPHYIHLVQKGETLYGLSKKYNVSSEEIKTVNPIVNAKGLVPNLEIFIPAKNISLIEHRVQKQETLYGISKKYQCSIEEILQVNPEVRSLGLKESQTLKIPISKSSISNAPANVVNESPVIKPTTTHILEAISTEEPIPVQTTKEEFIEEPIIKPNPTSTTSNQIDTLRFAVLLPFYLAENDSLILKKEKPFHKSEVATHIYAGILAAIDTISSLGKAFDLEIYDVPSDTLLVKKWLKEHPLKQYHGVIGPLYQNAFQLVAKEADKERVRIFCPVPNSSKIIQQSSTAFKLFPSVQSQYSKAGDYISKQYSKEKLIIIDQGGKNKEFAKALISKFNLLHSTDEKFVKDSATYLSMNKVDLARIQQSLAGSKKNMILVLSEEVVFVSDLVNKLFNNNKNDQIYLFASEAWASMNNLDIEQLQGLNTHIISSIHLSLTQDSLWCTQMFNKYGLFPDKYFLGGYNSIQAIYKLLFPEQSALLLTPKSMQINFQKPNGYSGWENYDNYIFKLEDFMYRQK